MYRVERNESGSRLYKGVGGAIARAIDAVMSPIAPRFVLDRQRARGQMSALLAYDAAASKRTRRKLTAGGANKDLLDDLPNLRKNSRAMCRDDSSAAAMVKVLEDNIVGTGLRPQLMIDPETSGLGEAEAERFSRLFQQFFCDWACDEADASEQASFWDMQRQVLHSLVVDGEALLHRTYVDPAVLTWRTIGTAFSLIDADRLQDPYQPTVTVRSGVEIGLREQARAYWITPRHPDDDFRFLPDAMRRNIPERIERFAGGLPSILHVFRRERPGQARGVPFFAPCFGLVEAMNDMLETELQAARAAAKFCAFIKQTIDAQQPGLQQEQDGNWSELLESGTIRYLNEGEELQSYTPNRPGNTFEPFVVRVLRSISAALNLPYELVLKDFGAMNYSSARVALLEARRGFEVMQQLLIEQLCQPVLRSVITDGITSGKLPMPRGFTKNPKPFLRTFWQPPAWGWVDPVKEIEASRMAIENNLSTPQAEAARQGGDAEMNLEMRGRFLARARDVETRYQLPAGALTAPSAPVSPAAIAPAEPVSPKNP